MNNPSAVGSTPGVQQPSAALTIVGLGPGSPGDLTLAAWQALSQARRVLLRTAQHPVVAHLPLQGDVHSCDDLYEEHTEFAAVYDAIAARAIAMAQEPGGVVYAVPGSPWVGEATTPRIQSLAQSAGLTPAVIDGLSFLQPVFAAVGIDPMDGAQVVDAMLIARRHHPGVEVRLPLLVAQVYARWLASDLKLVLMAAYPADHPVQIVRAAGTAQQQMIVRPLHALDADAQFDPLTSVYLPPQEPGRSFSDLLEIVAHLRAPEGCPWDREQTLESLRSDLLGECAEVLEAIDADALGDNAAHIAEEIGDLMMSACMMVQIASEEGRFQLGDAAYSIVTKLIRRHPHVFGDTAVDGVETVVRNWDAIKAQEKAAKGQAAAHPLDGVPAALPALEKARALQSKAQKAGLLDRRALAQENPVLAAALGAKPGFEAFGRALWQLVALAKEHDVVAEDALRAFAVAYCRRHGAPE